ncbi:MAG: hypothetical protein HQL33_07670 [Alphaproteobacteria bacterium]|nr:hypothetical protein [Alphaproteobacteria bacterium]MBF0129856.1 hypothetical protein [Alphaproteobacteria bacterium]
MFADQTLTPREAVRLCALGTIAAGHMRYSALAGAVRHFISRISGPSLELLGPSIELLRYERLVEPVDGPVSGWGMEDDALLRITLAGWSEFRRLMTARTRPSSDLSKLITALKFRFLHLLDETDRAIQGMMLVEACETELNRLLDLRNGGINEESGFLDWLALEIAQAEARLAWMEARHASPESPGPESSDRQ